MTIPIFIGGMIKMYIDKRFDAPLKKSRPELFKKGQDEKLANEKEKLHTAENFYLKQLHRCSITNGNMLDHKCCFHHK